MELENKGKRLPVRHEKFCQEYTKDCNGKKAAIRAGYSKSTAESQASRLLRNVKVKARVDELQARVAKKCELSAEEILNHLNTLRKAKINDYINLVTKEVWTGELDNKKEKIMHEVQVVEFKDFSELTEDQMMCIESIKQGKSGIELKLHGKDWSIEKIAKHIGFYEKDNDQRTPDVSIIHVSYKGDEIDLSTD